MYELFAVLKNWDGVEDLTQTQCHHARFLVLVVANHLLFLSAPAGFCYYLSVRFYFESVLRKLESAESKGLGSDPSRIISRSADSNHAPGWLQKFK